MENNAKKITEKVIEKINTKFDELGTRIGVINRKAEVAQLIVKENQNNSNLATDSTAFQEKLIEQTKET